MIATLMLSSGHLLANAFPPQAFVQAEERGQALLFTRLNNCYGITPAHVMGSDFFASLMGTGKNRPVGDADFLQKFGYDLSILYVSGSLSQHCGNNITDIPSLDDLLNGATRAVVSSVNNGGELTRQTQTVIDKGLIYFRVRPESPADRLYQGTPCVRLVVASNFQLEAVNYESKIYPIVQSSSSEEGLQSQWRYNVKGGG